MTNLFAILVLYIAGTLAVQSCSPLSILTSRTGEISSNAEGQTYSANANCTWVIRPTSINSGEVIVLFFDRFAVEQWYDYLSVMDGPTTSARTLLHYSGGQLPTPVRSTSNALTVMWTTDGSVELPGFSARYEVVPRRTCPDGRGGDDCDLEIPPLVVVDSRDGVLSLSPMGEREPALIPASYATGVAFDPLSDPQGVVYSDAGTGQIRYCTYPAANCRTILQASSTFSLISNVALDPTTNTVFYTDEGLARLGKVQTDGSGSSYIREGTPLGLPRGLALSRSTSRIFISDWQTPATILSVPITGGPFTILHQGDGLEWPNAVCIDDQRGLMYVADAFTKAIFSSRLDGSDFRVVTSLPSDVHPYGLVHHVGPTRTALLFTDWGRDAIWWVSLTGTTHTPIKVKSGFTQIQDLDSRLAPPSCGSPACSGHGACIAGGCLCDDGYSGALCQNPLPRLECPLACSGHGACNVYTGVCTCLEHFTGSACEHLEAGATCPDSGYHNLLNTTVAARGSEVAISSSGYNVTDVVVTNGNPVAVTDSACLCSTLEIHADPEAPCETRLTCHFDIDILKRCAGVSRTVVGNDETFAFMAHIGSKTLTGVDSRGHPVIRRPYQPFRLVIRRTVVTTAYSRMHTVSSVQYVSYEMDTSYFSVQDAQYRANFAVVINSGVYSASAPRVERVPLSVPMDSVRVERNPHLDDCPEDGGNVNCARGYTLLINGENACSFNGEYVLATTIRCVNTQICPYGQERDERVVLMLTPGDECDSNVLDMRVTAEISVQYPAASTAFTWDSDVTTLGRLNSTSPLSSSSVVSWYLCPAPATDGPCPTDNRILLVDNNVVTASGRKLSTTYIMRRADLHEVSFQIKKDKLHEDLQFVSTNNAPTTFQVEGTFSNFLYGGSSAANAMANDEQGPVTVQQRFRVSSASSTSRMAALILASLIAVFVLL